MKSSREGRKKIMVLYLINRRRSRRNRNRNSDSRRPCLYLATDLLYAMIMEYFNLHDQIRILCVSKRLSLLQLNNNSDSPMNRLPWLLEFDISKSLGFTCKLFDPIHERPYQIYHIKNLYPDYILSEHGWLLFLKEIKRSADYSESVAAVSLFCPYTKETMLLPKLELRCNFRRQLSLCPAFECRRCHLPDHIKPTATFSSSNPKSDQQCIFFVVFFYVSTGNFTVSSCRKDDKEWKTHGFTIPRHTTSIISTVYHEGKLYLHLGSGEPYGELIVIYDHQQQPQPRELTMLDVPLMNFGVYYSSCLLFVHQGSLHLSANRKSNIKRSVPGRLAGTNDGHFWSKIDSYSSKLFKWKNFPNTRHFDFEEEILENKALFLGFEGWDSPFVVEGLRGDKLGFLGNKVVHHDKCMEFYFDLGKREGVAVVQGKYFLAGKEDKSRNMAWIEPPNHIALK